MKSTKWIWILSAVLLMGMISCKKGDTGPAGAAGAAGAAGPAGAPGPDSVLTSNWIAVNLTDTTLNSNPYLIQEIPAPGITQAILDNGILLSYFQYVDGNNAENIFNASEAANVTFSVGNVEILVAGTDDFLTGFLEFRYVLVPGTLTTGNSIVSGPAKGLTKSELQHMNYKDVQKLLGSKPSNQ